MQILGMKTWFLDDSRAATTAVAPVLSSTPGNCFREIPARAKRIASRQLSMELRQTRKALPAASHTERSAVESKLPSEQRTESAPQKRPGGWLRDGSRLKDQPVRHGQSRIDRKST